MAQAAPTKGAQVVFPEAIMGLDEFINHAKPELEFVRDITKEKLRERIEEGKSKYGTFLETFNGRNAVKDAWEEAADLMFYIEQAIMEQPRNRQYDLFTIADLAREALLLLTEQLVQQEVAGGSR